MPSTTAPVEKNYMPHLAQDNTTVATDSIIHHQHCLKSNSTGNSSYLLIKDSLPEPYRLDMAVTRSMGQKLKGKWHWREGAEENSLRRMTWQSVPMEEGWWGHAVEGNDVR
jgi:hypothetical protein